MSPIGRRENMSGCWKGSLIAWGLKTSVGSETFWGLLSLKGLKLGGRGGLNSFAVCSLDRTLLLGPSDEFITLY